MADLVADYGVSRARIYSLMREKDKVARQEKPTSQQELKKIEVCREYLAGASVSDLVKKYNIRQDYIQKILNFGGIWIRDSAARTQAQVKRRNAFLKAIETREGPFIVLAKEFGYTPERARVILAVSKFEDTREEERKSMKAETKRLSRLSQEERESKEKQICELYQQGYSMRQVGKLVGVSHQTVNTITKKYGVQFSPQERRKLRLGARDEKLIEELLSSGKTVAEVAPKHGISQQQAYVVLREAGVYKNRSASAATEAEGSVQYGSVVHKNQEKIRTMYAAGYSGKNIAEEVNYPA